MQKYNELVDYLKRKCATMKLRYVSASDEDKKYYLPRKQWAEITLKELEHFEGSTNTTSLYAHEIETKYEPDYLKKLDKEV